MKKLIIISAHDLIMISTVAVQFWRSYHEAGLPIDEYPYSGHPAVTEESYRNDIKNNWNDFMDYYDRKIRPSVLYVLQLLEEHESKKDLVVMPSCFYFIARITYKLRRVPSSYLPVEIIQRYRNTITLVNSQINHINNNNNITMKDKYDTRIKLSSCASELISFLHDKKTKRLIHNVEYYGQSAHKKFFSIEEILGEVCLPATFGHAK